MPAVSNVWNTIGNGVWNARRPFVRWAIRGALIDLGAFCISLMFMGGSGVHYPTGPELVVVFANLPVTLLAYELFPNTVENLRGVGPPVLYGLFVVLLNGALYGVVARLVFAGLHRIRRARGKGTAHAVVR